ncbi:hypothetical protein BWI97_14435 [Siphonobacter sp. BAB-5405]|uniref:AAA family ATPase n=1 Tax=Siphonobacter sp. BAB-5405 TaxID=1864825 RepID=UPI000C80ED22|nr:AAA family ATPase [Siphonobacter sp. BAB-5405]PMD95550.1 hypothetical protein BWI97_14435 [Siphonobacter sp. BAB-5405]
MYIPNDLIWFALERMYNLHPFLGITFLTCKKNNLPIGKSIDFPIANYETKFLEQYFKPEEDTKWYFRAFRISEKSKDWLKYDYPSSGSQANRTQTFGGAFIHETGTGEWGWNEKYISEISSVINAKKLSKIPAFAMACWLYRKEDFSRKTNADEILDKFLKEFSFSDEELLSLFDLNIPTRYRIGYELDDKPFDWEFTKRFLGISSPPDKPENDVSDATLSYLQIVKTGPVEDIEVNFNDRVNIFTGDNGLGKTFILDCAWWILTNTWVSYPIFPENIIEGTIRYRLMKKLRKYATLPTTVFTFDPQKGNWISKKEIPENYLLGIYARVDGSVAIKDPLGFELDYSLKTLRRETLLFSKNEIWNGKNSDVLTTRKICNGLINDWTTWSKDYEKIFNLFSEIFSILAPTEASDANPIQIGSTRSVSWDSREMPFLKYSYGDVAIVHCSEAIKRIIALSYLIIWLWFEHTQKANLDNKNVSNKMVVIIDEVESHLHPKWQRRILPSLLAITKELSLKLDIQFIISTHSPSVVASLEPHFDNSIDSIFHLDINEKGKVKIADQDFSIMGSIDAWLTSDFFELSYAGSLETEKAWLKAKSLMSKKDVTIEELKEHTVILEKRFPNHNLFLNRWYHFLESKEID